MNLVERLRLLAAALPADGTVTLTRAWLVAELDKTGDSAETPQSPVLQAPLSPEQVGRLLDRSPITIRAYCSANLFPGAYRLRGRQWKIPPAAIEAFQAAEQRAHRRRAS